ncbi:MAG: hypothetical protein LBK42_05305 [Propionibacteriaceae bacterium]|jgi:uridine kinase|nr:hypothetical protein [Propionibacteriaceae bacterium]
MLSFAAAADTVAERLERLGAAGRPRFVAVDGLTGAGKTTFGGYLAGRLGGRLVHGDDLAQQGPELWDHARFQRDVWRPLAAGRPASVELWHWTADRATGRLEIDPATALVVVEGIHVLDQAVRTDWDLRLWLEVDEGLRHRRVRSRPGDRWDCWSTHWLGRELAYVQEQDPAGSADLIVDGDSAPAEA